MNAYRSVSGAVVLLLGPLALLSIAQPPGPPPGPPPAGGPMGMGMLLRSEEVRDELGLTEDQMLELREMGDEMRERFRDGRRGRRGEGRRQKRGPRERRGPRGEGGDFRDEMRGRMEEARAEAEGRLSEILDDDQMNRLRELGVQQQVQRGGPHALLHGELGETLDISDEQRDAMREKTREFRREAGERLREMRREGQEELLAMLTSEQRAQLDAMMGEPFDLPEPRFEERRGPRGFDGPPRRGRFEGGRRGPPGSARRPPADEE